MKQEIQNSKPKIVTKSSDKYTLLIVEIKTHGLKEVFTEMSNRNMKGE